MNSSSSSVAVDAARVVEPAAAVDDVVLLQHDEGEGVRELPAELRSRIAQPNCAQLRPNCAQLRACSTRSPEPIGGAWVKTIFQPSAAGCSRDDLLEPRELLVVDRHLVRRVLGAEDGRAEADEQRLLGTSRLNCIVGLLCALSIASRLASSVANSSIPSRSWFLPITSYGTPNEPRNSAASRHAVVPAKSSCVSSGRTDFDSPRSPRSRAPATAPSPSHPRGSAARARGPCRSPPSRWSRWRSPRTATVNSSALNCTFGTQRREVWAAQGGRRRPTGRRTHDSKSPSWIYRCDRG